MNLFIDTNIFLDFYHLSGADIEELHKLTALLESGGLKLFVPSQLCDEFRRNRDNKIKDAMNEFKKARFSINFPAFCKLYPEYLELRSILVAAEGKRSQLSEKAMRDVNAGTLSADAVIEELFQRSEIIATSDAIFNTAFIRFSLGNPPGEKR
jgi:predicted nucleic acid-binding protein